MSANTKLIQGIAEQFGAGLKMIEDIINECSDELWNDYNQEIIIFQVVYHAISSVDFYLCATKEEVNSFKGPYGDDDNFHDSSKNLTKKQLLDYLGEVKVKATKRIQALTVEELNEDPIYEWHGTSAMGSFMYNLRHLMLHVGALHVRVNAAGKAPLQWVSKIYGDERDEREEMNRKAVAYLQSGKFEEAEKLLEVLRTKYSEEPLYYYNLACCYSLQKKSEQSLQSLELCLKYDKDERFKNLAKNDSDFGNIKELPAFKELLNI